MQAVPHILVIDDDAKLRTLIAEYLQQHGMQVTSAEHTKAAEAALATQQFDALILDRMMPDEDGVSFLKRKANALPPVLMLTALGDTEQRIEGLQEGAADYLPKPFDPMELLLRVKNLIQSAANTTSETPAADNILFGPYRFSFDTQECVLAKNNARVKLTSTEAALITQLAATPNQPISREALSAALYNISERSIDVHITRLRKTLQDDPKHPALIKTVRNKGYMLCV